LHSFDVRCETNLLSLVRSWLDNIYHKQTKSATVCYSDWCDFFSPTSPHLNTADVLFASSFRGISVLWMQAEYWCRVRIEPSLAKKRERIEPWSFIAWHQRSGISFALLCLLGLSTWQTSVVVPTCWWITKLELMQSEATSIFRQMIIFQKVSSNWTKGTIKLGSC